MITSSDKGALNFLKFHAIIWSAIPFSRENFRVIENVRITGEITQDQYAELAKHSNVLARKAMFISIGIVFSLSLIGAFGNVKSTSTYFYLSLFGMFLLIFEMTIFASIKNTLRVLNHKSKRPESFRISLQTRFRSMPWFFVGLWIWIVLVFWVATDIFANMNAN